MILETKEIVLKDGQICILKSPASEDAKALIDYLRTTSGETEFMVRYPEEITFTVEEEEKILKEIADSNNSIMIAAFLNGELVGNSGINCVNNYIKLSHRASFGVAIKQKAWGLGIGNALLTEIIKKAGELEYEQIELGVLEDNEKAIRLYEKHGFVKCGIINNAFKLKDGSYRGEILMIRSL